MNVRNKSRRRLIILTTTTLLLIAMAAGAYLIRIQQRDAALRQSRADGITAFEQGDYFNALHKVGAYLGRNQDDTEALYYYARAQQHVEEPNGRHILQAIRLYLRLLDAEPNHPAARHDLLDLYVRHGFNTETIATADLLLSRNPDDTRALRAKASALSRLRRFDDALEVARRLNEAAPHDLDGQVMTVQIMVSRREPAEAILARTESLLEAHAGDPRFELLHSIGFAMVNDRDNARAWAKRAAAHQALDADLVTLLVHQLNLLELFDESYTVLVRAAADSDNVEVQRALAARLWELNRHDQMLQRLDGLDPADPQTDASLLALRAMALFSLDAADEARTILASLAERRADEVATAWASVLRTRFDPASADAGSAEQVSTIEVYQGALRRVPSSPHIRYLLGEAYAAAGEHDLALQQWGQAFAAAPAWAAPLMQSARLVAAGGNAAEALQMAEAARLRAPEDLSTLTGFAQVWGSSIAADDFEQQHKLLELVDEIQRRSPHEEQTLALRAALLVRTDQRDAAVEVIREALAATPPLSEHALLRLAALSRDAALGLEEECFRRSEQVYGLTPVLAYSRARLLLAAGDAEGGMRVMQSARPEGSAGRDWRLMWAQYLDQIRDERAGTEWISLAEDYPQDNEVQWRALGAAALQADRAQRGRILDRIGEQAGTQGVNFRIVRARWLLEDRPGEPQIVEAATLLSEITREAPELLPPRLLLASCLERLGNISGAVEQLNIAANLRPEGQALRPESISILLDLARLLQVQGDFDRARQHIDRVIQVDALGSEHRRSAARLLAQQGDSDRALALLQQGSAGDDEPPGLVLASLYRQRNQPEQAEAVYLRLLENPDAGTIYNAADFYASQGRTEQAQRVLADLDDLQLQPGVRELIRGDHQRRHGSIDDALREYELAARAAPANEMPWRQLALTHLALGQADEAIAAVNQALEALPGNPTFESFRQYIPLVNQLAGRQEARPLLMYLLEHPMEHAAAVDGLYILADEQRRGVNPQEIATRLRQVADRHPRCLPLQVLLVQRYIMLGRMDDAITIATRTMQLFPAAAGPAELAASTLASAGRWPEALAVANQWRQRTLTRPLPADTLIAVAQLNLNNPRAAATQLQPHIPDALKDPQAGVTVISLYARALIASGQTEQAGELLEPLAAKESRWRALSIQIALEAAPAGGAAADWLERVGVLTPEGALDEQVGLAESWLTLAQRTAAAEHRQIGRSILDQAAAQALTGDRVDPQLLLVIGSMYERENDPAAAEAAYRRSLELDSDQPIGLNNLAYLILNREGDLAEALQLASKAVQLDGSIPNFLDTLAWVQAGRSEWDNAVSSINRAIRLDPDNIVWTINLAKLLADAGRLAEAKTVLDEVDAVQPDRSSLTEKTRDRLNAARERVGSLDLPTTPG